VLVFIHKKKSVYTLIHTSASASIHHCHFKSLMFYHMTSQSVSAGGHCVPVCPSYCRTDWR